MPFLVTQESRLQRLPGAATADGPNFEWQMAGLLALRAYEQGLEFEMFSNVKVARPCDDLVLRLLGPAHLLPSPFMYFIQLKHSRPDVKAKTVTEQSFTSNSGDFSLPKYMEWFTKLRDQHKTKEFSDLLLNTPLENVRLSIYTTKDAVPFIRQRHRNGQAAPKKPFPFEDLFYTNDKGAEDVFSFDSSCPKVWQLFDQDEKEDLYQNEFLPSLKVFCNQTYSRDVNKVIEEQMSNVFGKKAKTFLQPFLESLRKWSENNDNDYCLSNKILTDFFGQELRKSTQQAICKNIEFKPEFLNDLRAALRNATSLLRVSVNEAKEPGLRAAKVLQAVRAEFGDEAWLYVDSSNLKNFKTEVLIVAAKRVNVFVSDVERKEDVVLVQNLLASIGRGILHVALQKATESDFHDVWSLQELSEKAQKEILHRPALFQGAEIGLLVLEDTWPSMRKDLTAQFITSEGKWSFGRPLSECQEGYVPRDLNHHHVVSARALVEKETNLDGGRLALVGFPDDLLKEAARRLGFLNSDHDKETVAKITNDNERWIVLKPDDNPSQVLKSLAEKKVLSAVHWLEFIGGNSMEDICMVWRDSYGKTEAMKSLIIPITDTCQKDHLLCSHEAEMSLKRLPRALFVGPAGIGKTTALLNFTHQLKKESEDQNNWVVMLKILEHNNLLMKWKDIKDVTVDHVVELVAAAAGAEEGGARRFLKSALTTSGAVTLLIDGVDEIAPVYMEVTIRLLERLMKLPIKRLWVSTRPEVAEPLRRVLRFPPLRLQPLSQQEQMDFLRNRLTNVIGEEVMQRLKNTGDLLATPLHLMMTTEVFNKSAGNFCENSITLLNVYKEFIDLKKQEYQKKFPNSCNLPLDDFDRKHEICAIVFLFGDDPLGNQLPIEEFKADIDNDKSLSQAKEKFGIVWFENKGLRFIHHTFAEYFAARWFLANTKKSEGARKSVLSLNKSEHVATRIQIFLQDMLAEDFPLHAAAWKKDFREMQRLVDNGWWSEQRDKIDPMLQGTWWNYLEWSYTGNFNVGRLSSAMDSLRRIFVKESRYSFSCTALRDAAQSGSHGVISELLRHKDFSTGALNEALREAARGEEEGHTKTMEILFANGAQDIPYYRSTALQLAASAGNTATVDLLLKRSVRNVNVENRGRTALIFALQSHHHEVVQRLLEEESLDVNGGDALGYTPLWYATTVNCVSCAETLLKRGANVNFCSVHPLIVAIEENSIDVLRFLLHNGADVNKKYEYGSTALISAVKKGHKKAIEVLLENGADITLTDPDGDTALDISLKWHGDDIVQILFKHINSIACSKEESDNTVLMALALKGYARIGDEEEVARVLQSVTFSQNVLNDALRGAVMSKSEEHTEIIKKLLDHGAKDVIGRQDKRSALFVALEGGNTATVELFLKHSACDPNARDDEGHTALHLAIGFSAARHNHDAAQILLQEKTVDVNAEDRKGKTPLCFAATVNCASCTETLLKRGAKVDGCSASPLIVAIEEKSIDVLKILLHNGADINKKDRYGSTGFISAVKKGHQETTEVLLENCADITLMDIVENTALIYGTRWRGNLMKDVFLKHIDKRTDLHWAALGGNAATVELLLKRSACDPNARDDYGYTSLHLAIGFSAARHKHDAAQILLQEKTVDVNAEDRKGKTPLCFAATVNCASCTETLLKRGAKVDGCSASPLIVAIEENSIDMLK